MIFKFQNLLLFLPQKIFSTVHRSAKKHKFQITVLFDVRRKDDEEKLKETNLLVAVDHAMLADIDSVFKAELVGHLPFGTLAQAHDFILET
jgi:hypothetical protein